VKGSGALQFPSTLTYTEGNVALRQKKVDDSRLGQQPPRRSSVTFTSTEES